MDTYRQTSLRPPPGSSAWATPVGLYEPWVCRAAIIQPPGQRKRPQPSVQKLWRSVIPVCVILGTNHVLRPVPGAPACVLPPSHFPQFPVISVINSGAEKNGRKYFGVFKAWWHYLPGEYVDRCRRRRLAKVSVPGSAPACNHVFDPPEARRLASP